eukprot:GILJ01008674.1.p1 GENE.GILJ01008674.1~~GILJ01008674.1.p1  ORF type:complete len:1307 (-),score=215.05 GILJ01008674.1:364-4284(-)
MEVFKSLTQFAKRLRHANSPVITPELEMKLAETDATFESQQIQHVDKEHSPQRVPVVRDPHDTEAIWISHPELRRHITTEEEDHHASHTGSQILVDIIASETVHEKAPKLNYLLFTVEIHFEGFRWQVKRKFMDFLNLHVHLRLSQFKRQIRSVPSFPFRRLHIGKETDVMRDELRLSLEIYLRQLVLCLDAMETEEALKFFQVSGISFQPDGSDKGREGYLNKRSGGRNYQEARCSYMLCCGCFRLWQKRWFVVRNEYVGYMRHPKQKELREVLLFDGEFEVRYGKAATGYRTGIVISNSYRSLMVHTDSQREMMDWVTNIKEFYDKSQWHVKHRFNSFAPMRENISIQYYIDGVDYFKAVADAIESAKHEIFISDWWLSPEVYLRRPPHEYPDSRLDKVLQKKAEAGVKIYISIYKEMQVALTINSAHTKMALRRLHPNIKVMRHPDHVGLSGVFFWSHHEKIVCVDQEVAFVGGLDLCYGRADTQQHPLTDLSDKPFFPGIDYANSRVRDFVNVHEPHTDLIERASICRMPWHDVSCRLTGESARDVARHFIQLWNHVKVDKAKEKRRAHHPMLLPRVRIKSVDRITRSRSSDGHKSLIARMGGETKAIFEHARAKIKGAVDKFRKKSRQSEVDSAHNVRLPSVDSHYPSAETHDSLENESTVVTSTAFPENDNLRNRRSSNDRLVRGMQLSQVEEGIEPTPELDRSEFDLDLVGSESDSESAQVGSSTPHKIRLSHLSPSELSSASDDSQLSSNSTSFLLKDSQDTPKPNNYDQTPTTAAKQNKQQKQNLKHKGKDQFDMRKQSVTAAATTVDETSSGGRGIGSISLSSFAPGQDIPMNQLDTESIGDQRTSVRFNDLVVSPSNGGFQLSPKSNRDRFIDFARRRVDSDDDLSSVAEDLYYQNYNSENQSNSRVREDSVRDRDMTLTDRIQRFNKKAKQIWGDFKDNIGPRRKKQKQRDKEMLAPPKQRHVEAAGTCRCQVVRSVGGWSFGLNTEASIQDAYLHLIENAQHFIYIENQFFMSSLAGDTIENRIGQAILDRISRAAQEKKPFRVFVVMPLLPGFEGELDQPAAATLRLQMHWQYRTISRGESSLIQQLKKDPNVSDPFDYISFNGLRTWEMLGDTAVTEQIYVHTKLMIVDDSWMIMGSANINDRSQIGCRDSEIAVVVEDTDKIDTVMNGAPFKASRTVYELRSALFKEHLGLSAEDVSDPISDRFYHETWRKLAASNTKIYRDVFRCVPDDEPATLREYKEFISEATAPDLTVLSGVHGHLVEFPLYFLRDESLFVTIWNREYVLPNIASQ